jgi:trk system potassium uptake protein
MDALFTATSAAAVTGLAVLSTSTDFTRLGQWVLLFLMEAGGLGFMVTLVLTLRLLGRHISLVDRLAVSSSLGLASPKGILQVLGRTVAFMLAVEGVGALILWAHWRLSGIVPAGDAAFYALFHSVAAFCNAGFDLFAGLPQYPAGVPTDPITLLALGWLVIIGGLGIPVYMELLHRRTARKEGARLRRLSLQTRLALWSALALVLVGWAGLLLAEYRQAGVLSDLSFGERVLRAWFQSAATRTAGFAGLSDFGSLHEASRLLLISLMFIGSAPASMGGGITTGTAVVLIMALYSYARNRPYPEIGRRTISTQTVRRATAVLTISLIVVISAATALLLSDPSLSLDGAIFEVVSAFATCGLTLAYTSRLSIFGQILIILVMIWGRLGALTVMVALTRPTTQSSYYYPEEQVMIG